MGDVKKYLFQSTLSERESHHSRLFVDLAENIHIHHREFRTVFSLDEYFEYADIINQSTTDVRNFLSQNPNYEEKKYPTTIMIAGGKDRQLKFLQNSPLPNKSNYFSNDFAIELQSEFVTDEIHIHYRDFRIGFDRVRFREVANGFKKALLELDEFEKSNSYNRKSHSDRIINNFNHQKKSESAPVQMGVQKTPLAEIKSYWHVDIESQFKPEKEAISLLISHYKRNGYFSPIILSTEDNGDHLIIDGHHRYYAAKKMQLSNIDAVIVNLSFFQSEKIRKAENLLKEFDIETNFKYDFSSYLKSFLGFKFNRYYKNVYNKKMKKMKVWYRALRRVKRAVFGAAFIFKSFNEQHNKG